MNEAVVQFCRRLLPLLAVMLCLLPTIDLRAQGIVDLTVSNVDELRSAIETANANPLSVVRVEIAESFPLSDFNGSGSATPVVKGLIVITGTMDDVSLTGGGPGSDFRAFDIGTGGTLILENLRLADFRSSGNGGCVRVNAGGALGETTSAWAAADRLRFDNCIAEGRGGAVFSASSESLTLSGVQISNCQATQGGAVAVINGGFTRMFRVLFSNNVATDSGGALFISGNRVSLYNSPGLTEINQCAFDGNRAMSVGGAFDFRDGGIEMDQSLFTGGSVDIFGCYGNVLPPADEAEFSIAGNQFLELDGDVPVLRQCDNSFIEHPRGFALYQANTARQPASTPPMERRPIDSTGGALLAGNLFSDLPLATPKGSNPPRRAKRNCADFGSGAFSSLGGNLGSDDSCALNADSDLVSSSPGLLEPDADGVLGLAADSPAIERGASGVLLVELSGAERTRLPCGYADIRGLGRPQDADGDGLYACDSGAWEWQAGPDLALAQSGIYFDPLRSGEGHFLERIGGGQALVSTFSYGLGGGMAWFIGVGRIVGNSVVIDEMLGTRGGSFGPDFDQDAVERFRVGGMSLVFADCEALARPGHYAFRSDLSAPFEDLSTSAVRLAAVIPCSGAPSELAWRSGAYFPEGRSGEGIFVQYLPDGRAVLVFYGYTPSGEQFWAFSDDNVEVDGDVLTAPMLYPASTTAFGRGFDPAQVDLQPFATIIITQTGCNSLDLQMQPSVAGFVGGSYRYLRLTQIEGTACPTVSGQ